MRRWWLIVAITVLTAACAGGSTPSAQPAQATQPGGATQPAEIETSSPTTTSVEATPDTTSAVVTPTTGEPARPEASEAEEVQFEAEHYAAGAGSNFPSLDDPAYVPISAVDWLDSDDVVMGVVRGETAVAFPVMQMRYHHIANVDVAGEPYLVTY